MSTSSSKLADSILIMAMHQPSPPDMLETKFWSLTQTQIGPELVITGCSTLQETQISVAGSKEALKFWFTAVPPFNTLEPAKLIS